MRDLVKLLACYFKGFGVGGELRRSLAMVSGLAELAELLGRLDAGQPYPVGELASPRGRQGPPREKVVLPYGWLASTELGDEDLSAAESDASGG